MDNTQMIAFIRSALPEYMDPYRLTHTLGVWKQCRAFAEVFCRYPALLTEDAAQKLEIAGLLHDISKEKTYEEQLELCKNYNIALDKYQKCSPKVLHQTTGAYLAKALFPDAVDETVLTAISCHTTGRVGMTVFDKLLFLADYIEPGRSFTDCVALREKYTAGIASAGEEMETLALFLDQCVLHALDMTITELVQSGSMIDCRTIAARNDLVYLKKSDAPADH